MARGREGVKFAFFVISCIITLISSAFAARALTPMEHIVGNLMPPSEAAVNEFTIGLINPDGSSYIESLNDYFSGNPGFYFVTGNPAYAGQHGGTKIIVRDSGVYDATIIYSARTTFAQGNLVIAGVSPLPTAFFARPAAAANARTNATFFFDAGRFIDMDYFDTNNLSGNNTSIVGLYKNSNGEPATTIFRRPEPTSNTMMRWRFNTPNNYIENVILDGSSINMRPPNGWGSGNDRGAYFVVVGINSDNFVARDVIIQNVGSQNTTIGGIFGGAAGNQRNAALNVLRAVTGQRNFENLTARNIMTTSGYAVIQFNNVMDTYFRDLDIVNPNAAGTGTAQHANAYPIKIEHNITQPEIDNWLGGDVSNQQNIIFDGSLLVPNRGTVFDGVYVQDYRYRNILVPTDFAWALCRNTNGNYTNFAMRVYNRKMSPITNNSALQLDTGYWFAEAAITTPSLQAQLDTINTVRNVTDPLTINVPAPNIKMVANNNGQLGGFTIPAYSTPQTNIVALMQTATPNATLYPATTHASNSGAIEFVPYVGASGNIIFPNPSDALIFNFNFKEPAGWKIEDAEGGAIMNFTRANSGRNLFLRLPVFNVTYVITGDRPFPHPAMPGNETEILPGTDMTAADNFALIIGEHNGVPGTWTFNGWTTADVNVIDGEFVMPSNDVDFVGTWTFTPSALPPTYDVTYTITGNRPNPHPIMPSNETNILPGTDITVADDLAPITGEHEGVLGTWTFNGWTTADVNVIDGEFVMPSNDVAFVGEWTFTPKPPPPYDVRLTKTTVGIVANNTALTYTLTIANMGNMPLIGLVITDNLPPQLKNPRQLVLPEGATGKFNGQMLTVILGKLAPNEIVTITFEVTISGTPGQTIRNTAKVSNDIVSDKDYADVIIPGDVGNNDNNGDGTAPDTDRGWAPTPSTPTPSFPPTPITILQPIDPTPMSPYHLAYLIGYAEDGTIRPNAYITRAEVATILFRLISDEHRLHIWSKENPFPDVRTEFWYNNAISTLTNDGLLEGYPDGYFRPTQVMTRAEFSALIVRIMGFNHARGRIGDTFADTTGHWATGYIHIARMYGWVQGYKDGSFKPDQLITRAEVAALVNRTLRRLPEHTGDLLSAMVKWPDNMNPNAWYYLHIQEATNSHHYMPKADGVHETWTELIVPREWWRLEMPDSTPHIFTGAYLGAGMDMSD